MTAPESEGAGPSRDVPGGVRSVATALDLLDCFAQEEELGVSDIARRLGVSKSTAHRILTTLTAHGLTEQDEETGRYRLGLHLFELGHLASSRMRLRAVSVPLLEELRERTGWTVHLSVPVGADVVFVERLPTLRGLRAMPTRRRRWAVHATSSGKAIAAYNHDVAVARVEAGLPRFMAATITDPAAFERELEAVRRRGYATAYEESMPSLGSVAAPVLDSGRVARAAISLAGSVEEFRAAEERLARVVMAAARKLSTLLGR